MVAIFINKMLAGEQAVINGDGKQTRDYVYVGDVVEANRLALKDGANGSYNVGTGAETDVNTIFRALKEFTGSTCNEDHGLAKGGEQARSCITPKRLNEELGWNANVPFAEGMKFTVEWFKERAK